MYSIQTLRRAHGRLNVQATHVLPVLFKQRHQKVDGHLRVDVNLTFTHFHVGNGHAKTEHLFQLVLDAALNVIDLVTQVLSVGHQSWELSGLVEARSQQPRDLLDDRLRSHKRMVLLG